MSTAFSNRFLHEISLQDPAMEELSNVLKQLSTSQHVLAGKLIMHIISNGWRYKPQDPKHPSWSGEPSELVLNSNRGLVENLKILLKKLKDHHHNTERNLIKGSLKRENLPLLWDQLDKLLVTEASELPKISTNAFDSINTSHGSSGYLIKTEQSEAMQDKVVKDEDDAKLRKEEKVTKEVKEGTLADIKEEKSYDSLVKEVFHDEKMEGGSSSEEKNISEESEVVNIPNTDSNDGNHVRGFIE